MRPPRNELEIEQPPAAEPPLGQGLGRPDDEVDAGSRERQHDGDGSPEPARRRICEAASRVDGGVEGAHDPEEQERGGPEIGERGENGDHQHNAKPAAGGSD
jgi:hypothetical protein